MTRGNVIELGVRLEGEGLQGGVKINLLFEAEGVTDDQMKRIYEKTDMSVADKVKAICGIGSLKFSDFVDKDFAERVILIDSRMGEILGKLVLDYYMSDVTDLKRLVGRLERKNPFGFTRDGIYEYKIKKLLYAAALGEFDTEEKSGETEEKADGVSTGLKSSSKLEAFMYGTKESVELAERIFERARVVNKG